MQKTNSMLLSHCLGLPINLWDQQKGCIRKEFIYGLVLISCGTILHRNTYMESQINHIEKKSLVACSTTTHKKDCTVLSEEIALLFIRQAKFLSY